MPALKQSRIVSPDKVERVVLAHHHAFRLGAVVIEPALRRLTHDDGRQEILEPRIMQVLTALAVADGAVLSREDLIEACWEGRFVSKDSLNRVISRLRAYAAGVGADSFEIVTLNKTGYQLVARMTSEIRPPGRRSETPGPSRRWLVGGGLAALTLAAAGGFAVWRGAARSNGPLTLAVLPFAGEGPDGQDLGKALAREIRQSLSRVAGLRTVSDASSFSVADRRLSPREAARSLGADLLVIGSLEHRGPGVQAEMQLLDGATEAELWSHETSGAADDLVEIGGGLASALLEEMVGRVATKGFSADLPPRRRSDPRAYPHVIRAEAAFLRTRSLLLLPDKAGAEAAADEAYSEAIAALAIDPDEVRALLTLSGLARNGWSKRLMATLPPGQDLNVGAMIYVRRALLANPNDPAALAALGDQHRRDWNWAQSEALLKRAIGIDPGLVEARWAYGTLLGTLNRAAEGVTQAREIVLLDPENIARRGYLLARLEYAAGDRTRALDHYRTSLQKSKANLFDIRELYMTFLTERNAAALDELSGRVLSLLPMDKPMSSETSKLLDRLRVAAAALRGRPAELLAMVDADVADVIELNATNGGRRGGDILFLAALEYGWAGAADRALDTLDRAVNAGSLNWIVSLPYGRAPFPKAVREHHRFAMIWDRDPRLAELIRRRKAAAS